MQKFGLCPALHRVTDHKTRPSFLPPIVRDYRLRLPTISDMRPTSALTKLTIELVPKSMTDDKAKAMMDIKVLHLSDDVTTRLHDAMNPGTECIRCSLDNNNYRKHTRTIKSMINAQRDKPKILNELSIEWYRPCIVTDRADGRSTTSEHADSTPSNKEARRHLLIALESTSPHKGQRIPELCSVAYIHTL